MRNIENYLPPQAEAFLDQQQEILDDRYMSSKDKDIALAQLSFEPTFEELMQRHANE